MTEEIIANRLVERRHRAQKASAREQVVRGSIVILLAITGVFGILTLNKLVRSQQQSSCVRGITNDFNIARVNYSFSKDHVIAEPLSKATAELIEATNNLKRAEVACELNTP